MLQGSQAEVFCVCVLCALGAKGGGGGGRGGEDSTLPYFASLSLQYYASVAVP